MHYIYIYIYIDHVKPYVDNIFVPSQDESIPRVYISAEVSISNLKILPKEKRRWKKENEHMLLHTLKATVDARIAYRQMQFTSFMIAWQATLCVSSLQRLKALST
jgi:hypothetical protein